MFYEYGPITCLRTYTSFYDEQVFARFLLSVIFDKQHYAIHHCTTLPLEIVLVVYFDDSCNLIKCTVRGIPFTSILTFRVWILTIVLGLSKCDNMPRCFIYFIFRCI